jgi:hypothetical protein
VNSFVPNLVWLPISIMKLTDHVPVVQAELQRLSWELFRHQPVRPELGALVEEAWDTLPVARYDDDREAPPTVNRFVTGPVWLNRRRTRLHALAGLLRARVDGHALRSVKNVQPTYAAGLHEVEPAACAALLDFLEPMLRTPALDETSPLTPAKPSAGGWVVTVAGVDSGPWPKNRAVLAVVAGLVSVGVAPSEVRKVSGDSRWRPVSSTATGDQLWADFSAEHGIDPIKQSQWFVDQPVVIDGVTWLLQSNVWGKDAEERMAALAALAPEHVQFRRLGED